MTAAGTALVRGDGPGGVPVLELEQVSKVYPGQPPVRALDQVSLAVAAGELVAVVGPSGSGKSTLLHLMGTLDTPTAGAVRVTGLDAARMTDRQLAGLRARRIGFVFQQFFLAEHQSVLGNVADGLLYAGVRRGARRMLSLQALDRVGLAHKAAARPAAPPRTAARRPHSPARSDARPGKTAETRTRSGPPAAPTPHGRSSGPRPGR